MADKTATANRDTAAPYPEEIKATYSLRLGQFGSLEASARMTPAGIIAAGIAASLIILAAGYAFQSRRRHRMDE